MTAGHPEADTGQYDRGVWQVSGNLERPQLLPDNVDNERLACMPRHSMREGSAKTRA
jgi:hypothetical protein